MFLTSNLFSLALDGGVKKKSGGRGSVADLYACDKGGEVISWLFRGRVGGISGSAGGSPLLTQFPLVSSALQARGCCVFTRWACAQLVSLRRSVA